MSDTATQMGADASIEDRIGALLDDDVRPEPVPEPVSEPEQEETTEEVSEEQEASEEVQEDAQQDGEELSLDDLSAYLGVESDRLDVDDDGKLYVKTKVDGQEGKATLADLVKSYQLEGHLNKQNMEVIEQRKALEQKQAELEQQSQARLQQLDDLANIAWQELTQEFNSVDWNSLRQDDPSEFAARKADFQDRQQRIQQMYQHVQTERQQKSQQEQERHQQTLRQESERLLSAIPEWRDEAVANKERGQIRDYAKSAGFTDQDIQSVSDHRVVALLRKAMLYEQIKQQRPEVTKKVKTLPKVQKPGAARSKADITAEAIQQKRGKLKKSGDVRDAVAILKDLL